MTVMIATANDITHVPADAPKYWEFTSDDVLNAYEKGKEDGLTWQDKVNRKAYDENLKFAFGLAEDFLKSLLSKQIAPTRLTLRPNSITSFDVAFIIKESDFYSDNFEGSYEEAHKVRKENYTDTFQIYFYFIPKSSALDLELMRCDGFTWNYVPKIKRPSPRTRKA